MKRGFTLVELLVVTVIIGILFTIGLSAYSSARDRQTGVALGEQITSILRSAQQSTNIGNKTCPGKFIGTKVSFKTQASQIVKINVDSICSDGITTLENTVKLANITVSSDYVITFNALRGIDLGVVGTELPITYTSNGLTYEVLVTNTGTIENKGVLP